MDLNEFPINPSKSAAFVTPDIRKQPANLPRINLKGILTFNEIWPLEGAMYITVWENSWGHPDNVSFMQFSLKIDGFRQKDHRAFRTHTTL